MPIAQLISAEQLASRLQEPGLRILDCRFALDNPEHGQHCFAEAHVPGAQYVDLERDLSGEVIPGVTGRHPLPRPADLNAAFQALGLNNDSEIVLYDEGPGAFAARAWWLLAWLGKRDGVYLLDGGYRAWCEAQRPLEQDRTPVDADTFHGQPDNSLTIDTESLMSDLQSATTTLIDARALPRFLGEIEPIDPVAGHIPGAACMPFSENLDASGRFRSPGQLRERFAEQLADRPVEALVAYCGSGVTACHNLFALCLAGYPLARLYPGSWSEWITDPQRPVA